jgi:integrase/recombinase XerD
MEDKMAVLKSLTFTTMPTPGGNGRAFSSVSLSMLFKEIYEMAAIRTSSHSGRRIFATRLNAKGVGMRTIQKLMGHRNIATTALYCEVSDETMRHAVGLV